MFLLNLFKIKKTCFHEKVHPSLTSAYCPDCGELINNEWYITRCSCCGIKLKTNLKNNEIVPLYNYCSNCGGKEFVVEKLESINFIDINFAVLFKRIVKREFKPNSIQCWQEKNCEQQKLLVQYL